MAIGYLIYLLRLPWTHYAYAALQESRSLLESGWSCWIADLNWVINTLPRPGRNVRRVNVDEMGEEQLLSLQTTLIEWCDEDLRRAIMTSPKCSLIAGRMELGVNGVMTRVSRKLCHYLALPIVPAHRKAFISIMFSSHELAVERLRWKERYRGPVPREWRLCRFCRSSVEDEVHALLDCNAHGGLSPIRDLMHAEVQALVPDFRWKMDSFALLRDLLHHQRLALPVAKFIHSILSVFYSQQMFIPAPYLYSPLLLSETQT